MHWVVHNYLRWVSSRFFISPGTFLRDYLTTITSLPWSSATIPSGRVRGVVLLTRFFTIKSLPRRSAIIPSGRVTVVALPYLPFFNQFTSKQVPQYPQGGWVWELYYVLSIKPLLWGGATISSGRMSVGTLLCSFQLSHFCEVVPHALREDECGCSISYLNFRT